ncbi:MAG TPA: hypothetical protein VL996_15235 [Methylocella sp.]|nr:hypothetical protein [Methylocella sp.]
MGMRNRILPALSFLATAVWQWFWEFVRSIFYDRGMHMTAPIIDSITIDQLMRWAPQFGFPILGFWLIWKTIPESDKLKFKENALSYWQIGTFVSIVLVGLGTWWIWPIRHEPPKLTAFSTAMAPVVPSSTTPAKQEPPRPWVTDAEIEQARKAGRILIPKSPEELIGLRIEYGEKGVSVYINKWIKISHKFSSIITEKKGSDKKDYLLVNLRGLLGVYLILEENKWKDKILTLRDGQDITTLCQIYSIDERNLYATNCDDF